MKIFLRPLLVGFGILFTASPFNTTTAAGGIIIVAPPAQKPKTVRSPDWVAPADAPASQPAPLGSETPPAIIPDAPPSVSLRPFLQSHLDKILLPLGAPAFAQSDLIANMRDAYARNMLTAPDARKPAYRLAMAVCDGAINAIGERQKAAAALDNAYSSRSSEAIQPRGGRQAVKDSDKDEWNFYNRLKNNWTTNAAPLRQGIVALYQRENAAETQAGPWPVPVPVAVATPAPAPDPVVGRWLLHGDATLTFGADNSIKGSREGRWRYTCTTNAGRNYELHWAHKDWVDYMVLSDDGKKMDGKTRSNREIWASRS